MIRSLAEVGACLDQGMHYLRAIHIARYMERRVSTIIRSLVEVSACLYQGMHYLQGTMLTRFEERRRTTISS